MLFSSSRTFCALATLALFGATGCPNNNDDNNSQNPTNNDKPDASMVSQDMSTSMNADMSADMSADMNIGVDGGVEKDMDVLPDASVAQGCVILETAPRTLPLDGGAAEITWTLECKQPLELSSLSIDAPRELSLGIEAEGAELCQPSQSGYTCVVRTTGLEAPQSEEPPRGEVLSLNYGAQPLSTTVRWHVSASALLTAQQGLVLGLEGDDISGGLFAKPKPKKSVKRRTEVLKAKYNTEKLRDMEGRVVVSSNPLEGGAATSSVEVGVTWSDLIGQNTESMNHEDGTSSVLWWGYDASLKQFRGATLEFGVDGEGRRSEFYESDPIQGESTHLVSILDARPLHVRKEDKNSGEITYGASVFVLGLNAQGLVVLHQPFSPIADKARPFVKGTFFGLDESKLTSKTVGFVKQQDAKSDFYSNANDEFFLLWSALPNDTQDKLDLKIIPTYLADRPDEIQTTSLDTGFAVTHTNVSQFAPGEIIVLAHGKGNNRGMYRLAYDTATAKVTSVLALELPSDVDVRPAPCTTPKKDTPAREWKCEDPVLEECNDGSVCGTTDHFRTAGRWPWNWRELKEARQFKGQPMMLDWSDDGSLSKVWPLTAQPLPAELTPGAPMVVSELADGSALSFHTANLNPAVCDAPGACTVQVAQGVFIGPGTSEPSFEVESTGKTKRPLPTSYTRGRYDVIRRKAGKAASKRVVAPAPVNTVNPGASEFVVFEPGSEDGSKPDQSGGFNLLVQGQPLAPNLVLHTMVSYGEGDAEELVMVFRPLVIKEGEKPKVVIVGVPNAEIEAALAAQDMTTVDIQAPALEIELHPRAMPTEHTPFQFAILPPVSADDQGIRSVSLGERRVFNPLSEEQSSHMVAFFPHPSDGSLAANTLSKKEDPKGPKNGGIGFTNIELVMAFMPKDAKRVPPSTLVSTTVMPGANELMFTSSPGYAFLISRKKTTPLKQGMDSIRIDLTPPLSQATFEAATYERGDFNGDGIPDLFISTDFTQTPDAKLTAQDLSCAGCVVHFGDGLGGFLDAGLDLGGAGPQVEWSVGGIETLSTRAGRLATRASSHVEVQ